VDPDLWVKFFFTQPEGERIVVIGKTPSTGLSAPHGKADVAFERIGKIPCEDCFSERYERKRAR